VTRRVDPSPFQRSVVAAVDALAVVITEVEGFIDDGQGNPAMREHLADLKHVHRDLCEWGIDPDVLRRPSHR